MIRINENVVEMDFGDQMIIEIEEKTMGINATGRYIYIRLKEGKNLEEIVHEMEKDFGKSRNYKDDIVNYLKQMNEFGVIDIY